FIVKSKAWGEIIEMPVQTGDEMQKGQLLARIDPRIPQQNLAQAQAALDKARAQLETATAQLKRSEALYRSQSISETEYESSNLAHATASAAVVNAEAGLQTAKDAMEDTQVRAPITGSILELDAVLRTVISSPTVCSRCRTPRSGPRATWPPARRFSDSTPNWSSSRSPPRPRRPLRSAARATRRPTPPRRHRHPERSPLRTAG